MTEMPRGLQAVWTAHGRPAPEPKQGLSLRRIVDAAIEIADAEGLSAVTMSRVARRLGFTTMSLYRHVANKDELVLHMQDTALGPPDVLDAAATGCWREDLERWALEAQARLRAHPWTAQVIPVFGPPATPNHLAWLERGLRALAPTRLTEGDKILAILLINAHGFGDLLFVEADVPTSEAVGPDPYGAVLRRLDPEEFPALQRAFRGGAFEPDPDPQTDRDAYFTFGLTRILDGIERLIQERA